MLIALSMPCVSGGTRTALADVPVEPFREGLVHRVRIEVGEAELQSLREDPRRFIRATIAEDTLVLASVGLRLKGSAGSFRPIDADKPGFSIKANAFVPGRSVWGLRKLLLNNATQDPSYLCETIGNELFRLAGVPAARTAFARVTLNGRELGLYVVLEGLSRDFLARHFESPHGSLYEGPGDIRDELDCDGRGPFIDRRELEMLARAVGEPSMPERWQRLGALLDLRALVSFSACETISWHWDGYAAGVNNFHMYMDPGTGRWTFLPHGGDQLFQTPDGPAAPGTAGSLTAALYSTAEGQTAYTVRLEALVNDPAVEGRLQAMIAELAPRIHAELDGDNAAAHDEAVASLRDRIRERFASLRQQLRGTAKVFPSAVELDADGKAHLRSWEAESKRGDAALTVAEAEGETQGPALRIAARDGQDTVASWRQRVWLEPGEYRLSGRVRTRGIVPTPTEVDEPGGGVRPGGVCLRISGRQPTEKLDGDRPWQDLRFDFRIEPAGGSLQEIELVCEARVSAGDACFDQGSLVLRRL